MNEHMYSILGLAKPISWSGTSNIRITEDITKATAITHSGIFHADEVMATYLLSKVYSEVVVYRTFKVPDNAPKNAIIYDIGHGRFDHHQVGGNGARFNGIPYSSCGLIWKKYGSEIVSHVSNANYVWKTIDKELISGIDAIDNGVFPKTDYPTNIMSISGIISSFNPAWDNQEESSDDAFLKAVFFAGIVFENVFKRAISTAKAEEIIEEAIEKSQNHIMILEKFAPWQDFIFSSENPKASDIWYIVFPSLRGGYNFQCVPDVIGGNGQRKPIPTLWRGLRDEELQKVTGVKTATFVHPAGFIGGALTQEDAIKLAEISSKA